MPLASKTVAATKFIVSHNLNILFRSYWNILLEKLWCGNWSWKVSINHSLSIFCFILIEMWKDPLLPSFWVSKLLWNLNFLEKLRGTYWSWKIAINDSLDIFFLIFIEVWKDPLFPCFWISKLLWNLDFLKELWSTDRSWEVSIYDTLDVFLLIFVEMGKDPLFPCFWISKLLRDFPFLEIVWPAIVWHCYPSSTFMSWPVAWVVFKST